MNVFLMLHSSVVVDPHRARTVTSGNAVVVVARSWIVVWGLDGSGDGG